MKILITGAAGAIGTVLAEGLRDRHELRGFDCQKMPEITDAIVGDIGDFDEVKAAAEKPDEVAPEVPTGPSQLDILIEIRDALKK